jgi:inner membrane protein
VSRRRADPARLRRIAGAVAGIAAVDVVRTARRWPVPVAAALDWPAHLATAALVLAAGPRWPDPGTAAWALAGSVAIDVDHVPLYVGLERVVAVGPGGRPVTHSPATAVALLAGARLTGGRARTALAGLSAGVLLHFVRDVATGPGLPLLWPFSDRNSRIPYAAYLAPVAAAALGRAILSTRSHS